MSERVDEQRKADALNERWRRLDRTLAEMALIARLRSEGRPMVEIAGRLGWHPRTLERWMRALRVLETKGIRKPRRT